MLPTPSRSWPHRILLVIGVLAAALAGCQKAAPPHGGPPPAAAAEDSNAKSAVVAERHVIKKAELSLSVAVPAEAQRQALLVAKTHGGYTVDTTQSGRDREAGPELVQVVLRVRGDRFELALDDLRRLGARVGEEKVTSQDVTEEFLDLGARLRTQKKLEERYLVLLERATTVEDTIKVEQQLATVRGEIEKLEGREKYLKDQVGLATITASFYREQPVVALGADTLSRAAKRAYLDAINVAGAIVVGGIRLTGALLPVFLLVLLPLGLVLRLGVNRLSRAPSTLDCAAGK